jgi:uncharacterized protein YdeI (YjbR/CyaY-like superfamily)
MSSTASPGANPKVDKVWSQETTWGEEKARLRTIVLGCGLEEALKWGQACYMTEGRNVLLIHGFKDYCALLFFKGALMKDPNGILIQQTENVQAGRQIRFANLGEIGQLEPVLEAYVRDAIAVELSGAKVAMKKTADFAVPDELTARLEADAVLKTAFEALTPGRQKAYLLHFAGAKQSATREARIDKARPRILEGKGLLD